LVAVVEVIVHSLILIRVVVVLVVLEQQQVCQLQQVQQLL
jgi:hypothetical protein